MVSGLCPAGTVSPSGLERPCRSSRLQPAASSAAAAATRTRLARQREDIEHASRRRLVGQVLDGVGETERAGRVARVEVIFNDPAGPAAYARHDGDILAAVGPAV